VQTFEISDGTPDSFLRRVREVLLQLDLAELVSLTLEGSQLVVRFSRLGTTVLCYRLTPMGSGFNAYLESTRIAPLHAAFRQAFEDKLAMVLERCGARLASA